MLPKFAIIINFSPLFLKYVSHLTYLVIGMLTGEYNLVRCGKLNKWKHTSNATIIFIIFVV